MTYLFLLALCLREVMLVMGVAAVPGGFLLRPGELLANHTVHVRTEDGHRCLEQLIAKLHVVLDNITAWHLHLEVDVLGTNTILQGRREFW